MFQTAYPDAFDCKNVDLGEQEYTILIYISKTIAVLSKLMTNVGQRIDSLIVVYDVCLFDCLQLVN